MQQRERRPVRLRPVPKLVLVMLTLAVLALGAVGCGRDDDDDDGGAAAGTTAAETGGEQLSGDVLVDGSSTVGPLTTAAAESYREQQPDVNVEVGISGTGGGFERFCAGETDISDASRPIEDDEAKICSDAGIEYVEYQVGVDAPRTTGRPASRRTSSRRSGAPRPRRRSRTGTRSIPASPTSR
jgi:ABC-type phosphate transport system substrate-binding protein